MSFQISTISVTCSSDIYYTSCSRDSRHVNKQR